MTTRGLASLCGRLRAALERLISPVNHQAGNERLAAFLEQHLDEDFWFLQALAANSATSNESEFELRFNVIACKLSGGNRAHHGRIAQEILFSTTRTCHKLDREPYDFRQQTFRSLFSSHSMTHHGGKLVQSRVLAGRTIPSINIREGPTTYESTTKSNRPGVCE